MDICFYFSGEISKSGMIRSYSKHIFNFLSNCQTVFQSGCVTSHSVSVWEFWLLHTFANTKFDHFGFSHLKSDTVASYCDLNLPNDYHVLLWQSFNLFSEVTIQIFCSVFYIGLFVKSNLSVLSFVDLCLSQSYKIFPMLPSVSFVGLGFTFRPMIHFE